MLRDVAPNLVSNQDPYQSAFESTCLQVDDAASLQPGMGCSDQSIGRAPIDFRMLVEAVSDYAVYMLTTDGFVSSWNIGAERSKGYTTAEAIGMHFSSFYTFEDRIAGAPLKALREAEKSKFDSYGWRVRKDGSKFWAHVVVEAIRDPAGAVVGFAKVTCDVTAQKLERDTLVRNLDAALSNMSQGLCLFDAGERIVIANSRVCEIHNLSRDVVRVGMLFRDLIKSVLMAGNGDRDVSVIADEWYERHRHLIQQPGGGSVMMPINADCLISIVHRPTADGSWVTTFEDISERSRSQGQIAHMALHDGLTDLPNRTMFCQRLEDAIKRCRRGAISAVLCLDLDRFKIVNDTLGHPVGDALLVSIAEKLKSLARETDTIARLGGDDFAIIQTELRQASDATILADRVILAFNQPHDVMGHLIVSNISIGIALAPNDGTDPDQLFKSAELALSRAKREGRNRYCYFEPEMHELMQRRRSLEADLRTAFATKQFELYYQPIIDIERNKVCAFEALLRWRSPQRGMVSPADFIPLAEEIGLIVDIGAWALETACAEAMQWPDQIKVAVNVSVAQFKGFGLVETVRSALQSSGLAPKRLEIEITESIMINDSKHTHEVLHMLKEIGLSVSMDDFGTGYSSLSYLRRFPLDKIKIDQSFIRGIENADECKAIVKAVIGICTSLDIVATAEGVENNEQMEMLRLLHCHQAQGYLISRPCPASSISNVISSIDGDSGRFKK